MEKTIVIIDDDPEEIEILKEVIGTIDPSLRVSAFRSATEAIQALTTDHPIPGFIFLDWNMNPIGGEGCLRSLRSSPRLASTVITVISNFLPIQLQQTIKGLGANFSVQKPSSFESYGRLIDGVLNSKV